MSKYARKLFLYATFFIALIIGAFLNWLLPLYRWFGDTPTIRFIWLGIFFVILDIAIEMMVKVMEQFRLIGESMGLAKDIKKISGDFKVAQNVSLPSNLKADFVVVGSSGIWLIMAKDDTGKVVFSGDDIIQDGTVLKGLLTSTLEKAYSLAGILKQSLIRDIIVTPVIAFSSHRADLESVPKTVRGVRLSSRKDIVHLIEDTDIQLIDKNTADAIYKILKK